MLIFNEIMALIMPSIVGLLFYAKLHQEKLTWFDLLGNFSLFLITINCVCYGIVVYFKKIPSFDMAFTMKYSLMATTIAVLFSLFYRFIELNVKLRLKVERGNERG